MLIGGDNYLGAIIEQIGTPGEEVIILFQNDFEPLKIISDFLIERPSVLIIDDDSLSPNTFSIIDTICRLNERTRIIFITSSTSIELGRQISQLGIYYYAIKPLNESEILDVLSSILNKKKHINYLNFMEN